MCIETLYIIVSSLSHVSWNSGIGCFSSLVKTKGRFNYVLRCGLQNRDHVHEKFSYITKIPQVKLLRLHIHCYSPYQRVLTVSLTADFTFTTFQPPVTFRRGVVILYIIESRLKILVLQSSSFNSAFQLHLNDFGSWFSIVVSSFYRHNFTD